MNPWVPPITLTGRIVRLEPLEQRHAPGLHGAAEPGLFQYTPQMPEVWSTAGFEKQIDTLNAMKDVVPFAMVLIETGAVIGRTTYMDINASSRGLEIGRTWIARAYQGTLVNPEVKFLIMRHAFEQLAPTAIRVQYCTGGTNLHSQPAIAKLGAAREGVLRNHRVVPDGPDVNAPRIFRDTVVFSVIEQEWPAVKRGLVERIGWGA